MPNQDAEIEGKLRLLGDRVQRGVEKLYRATEGDLKIVRKVVQEAWERQQKEQQKQGEGGATQSVKAKAQTKKQQSIASQDEGAPKKTQRQSRGRSR